jgi:hypothetical protein
MELLKESLEIYKKMINDKNPWEKPKDYKSIEFRQNPTLQASIDKEIQKSSSSSLSIYMIAFVAYIYYDLLIF